MKKEKANIKKDKGKVWIGMLNSFFILGDSILVGEILSSNTYGLNDVLDLGIVLHIGFIGYFFKKGKTHTVVGLIILFIIEFFLFDFFVFAWLMYY
jgi:hypothetical protein